MTFGAGADLPTFVRGGCPDESDCCFGKWKVKSNAIVYDSDEGSVKVGELRAGREVEVSAGRVHSSPGKVRVLADHGEWKKSQIIGLYREPDQNGKARIGTADRAEDEEVPFLKRGAQCAKPSEGCWASALSRPRVKWWLKVKVSEAKSGWVDASHIGTDSKCRL